MGGSNTKEVALNAINDAVATIFTNVALSCSDTAGSNQSIIVNCSPPLDPSVPSSEQQPYENQPACLQCMDNIVTNQLNYYDLQRSAWAHSEAVVNKPIDQDYQQVIQEFIACGEKCKACVIMNLAQTTIIKNVVNCQSFLSVQNIITQQLSAQITQTLTNNQSFLAPLAQMLGASRWHCEYD
jgi:hypothetical protein